MDDKEHGGFATERVEPEHPHSPEEVAKANEEGFGGTPIANPKPAPQFKSAKPEPAAPAIVTPPTESKVE